MKILIDLQGAQGANEKRGIGRYALSFSKYFIESRPDYDISILLNGSFLESIDQIKSEIWKVNPDVGFHVWSPFEKCAYLHDLNNDARKFSEYSRESFIASLDVDIVIVTSMFEGLVDDCVLSHRVTDSKHKTITILYDLIPLIHKELYLSNEKVSSWYYEKLSFLAGSDYLFAISESSRSESIRYLNYDPSKVFNISTACDSVFEPNSLDETSKNVLFKRYDIRDDFILYTGGIDHRKNIERLVEAFSIIRSEVSVNIQLVVVCAIQSVDRERLTNLAKSFGLDKLDIVYTGYVPEQDLISFYNTAQFFIFPSWHEGFGLPVLEAMKCGCPVIGSNLSSIPEVIGNSDYLFDPYNIEDMASCMRRMLEDKEYRQKAKKYCLERAEIFSWNLTAERAWSAVDSIAGEIAVSYPTKYLNRPRLAFISPLPPGASGISDYSADLIPGLSKYYSIDVVVDQEKVDSLWISNNCRIVTVKEFIATHKSYDRVVYHFGNSDFHSHMFELVEKIPGIVVLHDFFLSGIVAHMDIHGNMKNYWPETLLENHGWPAVEGRFKASDTADIVFKYPCNLPVLQSALGVIVHSEYSKQLARNYYGEKYSQKWEVIPLLRKAPVNADKKAARIKLGIPEDAYLVCSFGHIGPTKLNDRLLDAWISSDFATSNNAYLVFVGQNHPGPYGNNLAGKIKASGVSSHISITGWNSAEAYADWLAAADAGIQLRTLSRGETSAAVFDCLNYGLATIVNANGSMDDLNDDLVIKLTDQFEQKDLVESLNKLNNNSPDIRQMAALAKDYVRKNNSVGSCSSQYFKSIESLYKQNSGALNALIVKAGAFADCELLASNIATNFPSAPRITQLLIDVSELIQRDARSGIQRVVRSIIHEFLHNPPSGYHVRLVYTSSGTDEYYYADRFTCNILGIPAHWASDGPIESWAGDIFLGLDLQPFLVQERKEYLKRLRARGITVKFVVYDIIPILMPEVFPPEADINHHNWLKAVEAFDGAICISKAVADDLFDWLETFGDKRFLPFSIDYFHLGADVQNSIPDVGHENLDNFCAIDRVATNFLMVGTIEPRKGHQQVLEAFEILWNLGREVRLIIVGKQGWMVEQLIDRLRNHPLRGDKLVLLEGVSDNVLLDVYSVSDCLIVASEAEGFGLPLIEGAEHQLSIIARDLPVFREVAGGHAYYFDNDKDPRVIVDTINRWLEQAAVGRAPTTKGMTWLNWAQSAQQLKEAIFISESYKKWLPSNSFIYWGSDRRLNSKVGIKSGKSIKTSGDCGFLLFGPYVPLASGKYKITVFGKVHQSDSTEWFDVACDSGTITLAKMGLGLILTDSIILVSEFFIDHDVKDFEFRCHVSEKSNIVIERIVLEPMIDTKLQNDKQGGAEVILAEPTNISERVFEEESRPVSSRLPNVSHVPASKSTGNTYNKGRNGKAKKNARNRKQ